MRNEIFERLTELRDSGAINMFDAPYHIALEFGLIRHEARAYVTEWMNSYE